MLRLYSGLGLLVLGVLLFVGVNFYGWASQHPNASEDRYEIYQAVSAILGLGSVVALALGLFLVLTAIRRINREEPKRLDGLDE